MLCVLIYSFCVHFLFFSLSKTIPVSGFSPKVYSIPFGVLCEQRARLNRIAQIVYSIHYRLHSVHIETHTHHSIVKRNAECNADRVCAVRTKRTTFLSRLTRNWRAVCKIQIKIFWRRFVCRHSFPSKSGIENSIDDYKIIYRTCLFSASSLKRQWNASWCQRMFVRSHSHAK